MDEATSGLLAVVRGLEPVIREHALAAEANREMAPEVMSELVESGLLRMWIPKEFGGSEVEPNGSLAVMEELARIDAATGWVVSNCCFISTIPRFLPHTVVDKMLADPAAVICGSFVPPCIARATADGYTVTGNWTFGSASRYATTLTTLVVVSDDDGPVVGPDGTPTSLVVFFGPEDVTFHDTWYTLGLRATGSTNFSVENLAVPSDHAFPLGASENTEGPFAAPLFRMGIIMDAVRIAQVGVGIAQSGLEAFIELASAKTPAYTATLTADRPTVQEQVAQAQALIQASRTALRGTVGDAWEAVQDGSPYHRPDLCADGVGGVVHARCFGAGR